MGRVPAGKRRELERKIPWTPYSLGKGCCHLAWLRSNALADGSTRCAWRLFLLHTAILGIPSAGQHNAGAAHPDRGVGLRSGRDRLRGTDRVASQKAAGGEEMMHENFGLRPSPPQRNPSWHGIGQREVVPRSTRRSGRSSASRHCVTTERRSPLSVGRNVNSGRRALPRS